MEGVVILLNTLNSSSDYSTVTATSQQLEVMGGGQHYRITSSVAAYVAFGADPTASAGNGSHYLPADVPMEFFCAGSSTKIAIVRIGILDGVCTLSRMEPGA